MLDALRKAGAGDSATSAGFRADSFRWDSMAGRILAIALAFLCLQGVFFLSNLASAALPKESVNANLAASADDDLLAKQFSYDSTLFGSSVSFDNNRFIEAFANQYDFDGDVLMASIINRIDYSMPDSVASVDYFRYWHGWQLPVFLVLSVGRIGLLSLVLGILAWGGVAFFLIELHRYAGWLPAIAFTSIALFSTNLIGNFKGDFLLCLSMTVVVICAAFILRAGRRANEASLRIDVLCMASGCFFCFFDFFTIPAFALAFIVFASMVASGALEKGFKESVLLMMRFVVLFAIGFVGTWACKWLLASVYLGIGAVLANVLGETAMWSQSGEGGGRLYAIRQSLRAVLKNDCEQRASVWNPAGIAACVVVLACFVLACIAAVQSRAKGGKTRILVSGGTWSLLVLSLAIPIYVAFSHIHVLFHLDIFGYKSWAFVLADVAFFCSYAFIANRGGKVMASGQTEPVDGKLESKDSLYADEGAAS